MKGEIKITDIWLHGQKNLYMVVSNFDWFKIDFPKTISIKSLRSGLKYFNIYTDFDKPLFCENNQGTSRI